MASHQHKESYGHFFNITAGDALLDFLKEEVPTPVLQQLLASRLAPDHALHDQTSDDGAAAHSTVQTEPVSRPSMMQQFLEFLAHKSQVPSEQLRQGKTDLSSLPHRTAAYHPQASSTPSNKEPQLLDAADHGLGNTALSHCQALNTATNTASRQYESLSPPTDNLCSGETSSDSQFRSCRITDSEAIEIAPPVTPMRPEISSYTSLGSHRSNSRARASHSSSVGPGSSAAFRPNAVGHYTKSLKPSFKKRDRPRKFFRVGKVFRTLCTEPCNETSSNSGSSVTGSRFPAAFGEFVWSKPRMLVVIRESDDHCTALPIFTYGGKGEDKPRLIKFEHGEIFPSRSHRSGAASAYQTEAESNSTEQDRLQPVAIRVNIADRTDPMKPKSLINYGKPITVEHYWKVKYFGDVHGDSIAHLLAQARDVYATNTMQARQI